MMLTRCLTSSTRVLRLSRGFGGGHGGQNDQINPNSSIDKHYLKHYGPEKQCKSEAHEQKITENLSPEAQAKVNAHANQAAISVAEREKFFNRLRSIIVMDKVFEAITSKRSEKAGKEAPGYEGLSASDRYVLQLLDVYKRTEAPTRFTATNMLKNLSPGLSKRVLDYLHREVDAVGAEREVAEDFNPPKIHENSVFLYQSTARATKLRRARISEVPVTALLYAIWPHPMLTTTILAASYFIILRASHFEVCNRFVTRMDLLPHLEMISFQKIGLFGRPITRLVRIKDLEKIEPNFSEENAFWGFNQGLDSDLMYKDKTTGELFVFDRNGYWNWEGISHKLLY
jgi:hypothetical protein